MKETAQASVPVMRELWAKQVKASQDKVEANGAQVILDIDKQPFIDAMKPVYDKYVTTPELKDLVTRIQETK